MGMGRGSRPERLLEDRVQFETLLSDLSAGLIHVDASGLDAALERGIQTAGVDVNQPGRQIREQGLELNAVLEKALRTAASPHAHTLRFRGSSWTTSRLLRWTRISFGGILRAMRGRLLVVAVVVLFAWVVPVVHTMPIDADGPSGLSDNGDFD